jgi:cyclohexadieny/prephenate dehydrogenase
MSVLYDRVALIGLGLIAGSMAHAMRRRAGGRDRGHARSAETRRIAREIGLCDRIVDTAAEAVEGADLVVLACRWARWARWPPRSRRTLRPARR